MIAVLREIGRAMVRPWANPRAGAMCTSWTLAVTSQFPDFPAVTSTRTRWFGAEHRAPVRAMLWFATTASSQVVHGSGIARAHRSRHAKIPTVRPVHRDGLYEHHQCTQRTSDSRSDLRRFLQRTACTVCWL